MCAFVSLTQHLLFLRIRPIAVRHATESDGKRDVKRQKAPLARAERLPRTNLDAIDFVHE